MHSSAVETVERFWQLMASNDFDSVGEVLADTFVLEWPQTGERIRGRTNFAGVNREYPANGRWCFKLRRLFGDARDVVTEVEVSDGVQHARALSFFTVEQGRIVHLREFWPEDYVAPDNRSAWVERYDDSAAKDSAA